MKTVIEMAREVLLLDERDNPNDDGIAQFIGTLTDFAALARANERNSWPAEMEAMERQVNILTDALAEEREACAKVCDDLPLPPDVARSNASIWEVATLDCAEAIRNRSNT